MRGSGAAAEGRGRVSPVRAAAVFGSLVALLVSPPPAGATHRVIHVHPGPQAISQAIDVAHGGDVIVIHEGRYPEHVVVDKRLRVRAAAGDSPVIDGTCDHFATLEVRANEVVVRGLKVIGGQEYEVHVAFVRGTTVRGVTARDTCGAAEYGVNVFNAQDVLVAGGKAQGFHDAGIYVGGIPPGQGVTVKGNNVFGNNRGIIVEDSADVDVEGNRVHDNDIGGLGPPTGIWFHDGDSGFIGGNIVRRNGTYGLHFDPQSGENIVSGNTIVGNDDLDVLDEGTGNCFSNNTIGTSQPDPLQPC
jgi:parallel beta-helix repeat protein